MSNIYSLIPKIMDEVGAVEKNRHNSQGQGYRFRGIDDVLNALHGPMAKHGVFCAPEVLNMIREERQSKSGGNLIYTILDVKFTYYAPDGSHVVTQTKGEAMDSGDKSCNKAMSAAMKYSHILTFAIPTVEEKDTETETHETKPKSNQQSSPQQKAESSAIIPEVVNPGEMTIDIGKEGGRKFKDVDHKDLQRILDWIEHNKVTTPKAQRFKSLYEQFIQYELDKDVRMPG